MTKRGLGRGLGALIPEATPPAAATNGAPDGPVQEVDIDLIVPNPNQPRSVFTKESLAELTESIREHGVIQPLIVSRKEGDARILQLIAGERRLLAAREAGLKRVPVVIREANALGLLELALVENLQREDLGPLEEAVAYRRLIDEFSRTQEEVATRMGRSRSYVANTLRLLSLPEEIRASLAGGQITAGHARALLSIEDEVARRRVWQAVVSGGLTVRQAEELAKAAQSEAGTAPPAPRPSVRSPEIGALEEKLRSILGTKVELASRGNKGRLTIHFYSAEERDAILDRLLSLQE
jgi:ParB family chromosome partitioning protein